MMDVGGAKGKHWRWSGYMWLMIVICLKEEESQFRWTYAWMASSWNGDVVTLKKRRMKDESLSRDIVCNHY